MRHVLLTLSVGIVMALLGGCRAEEKPMPPPNPSGQPQAQPPSEGATSTPASEATPGDRH